MNLYLGSSSQDFRWYADVQPHFNGRGSYLYPSCFPGGGTAPGAQTPEGQFFLFAKSVALLLLHSFCPDGHTPAPAIAAAPSGQTMMAGSPSGGGIRRSPPSCGP